MFSVLFQLHQVDSKTLKSVQLVWGKFWKRLRNSRKNMKNSNYRDVYENCPYRVLDESGQPPLYLLSQ